MTYTSKTASGVQSQQEAGAKKEFRLLMINTKKEELAEENERKSRLTNFIIHEKGRTGGRKR